MTREVWTALHWKVHILLRWSIQSPLYNDFGMKGLSELYNLCLIPGFLSTYLCIQVLVPCTSTYESKLLKRVARNGQKLIVPSWF